MSLKSIKEIVDESPGATFEERVNSIMGAEIYHTSNRRINALSECRTAVNHQIEFLEREMGIEEAFPVTIGLLRVSQDLTRRINAVPICGTPKEDEQPTKAYMTKENL